MAKIKPTKYPDRVWHGRGVNIRLVFNRVGPSRGFQACAVLGQKGKPRERMFRTVTGRSIGSGHCAYGKNPRVAAKRALAKLGKRISGRTGAFQGLD